MEEGTVKAILERYSGLNVEVVYHPSYAGKDSRVVAEVLGVSPEEVVKALVLKVQSKYVVLVVPSTVRADLKRFARILGVSKKKIRLATVSEVRELGYEPWVHSPDYCEGEEH